MICKENIQSQVAKVLLIALKSINKDDKCINKCCFIDIFPILYQFQDNPRYKYVLLYLFHLLDLNMPVS